MYPLRNTVERTDEYQRKELMRIFPLLKRCAVSAHRVPVQNGHFVDLKLQTKRPVTTKDEVKKILRDFAPLAGLGLPSMPDRPIVVLDEVGRPRPKLDSDYEGGMAVCVGNVHTNDGFFDVTLSLCVNNVVRGAWGAALLNLELYDLHVRPSGRARAAGKNNWGARRARCCQRGLGVPRGEGAQEAVAALGRVTEVGVEHRLRVVACGSGRTRRSSGSGSGPGRTSSPYASTRRSSGRRRRPTCRPETARCLALKHAFCYIAS